jgi:hypothetical protein
MVPMRVRNSEVEALHEPSIHTGGPRLSPSGPAAAASNVRQWLRSVQRVPDGTTESPDNTDKGEERRPSSGLTCVLSPRPHACSRCGLPRHSQSDGGLVLADSAAVRLPIGNRQSASAFVLFPSSLWDACALTLALTPPPTKPPRNTESVIDIRNLISLVSASIRLWL